MGRIFFWKVYLIFLPLCIILLCLGRNLFWNAYQIFGKKILLQVVRDIVTTMCPTFIFEKTFIQKFVPIFVKKILLRVAIDIGKKVILKFVLIFGKKFLLKALLDIVTIMYPTLLFGKKFILKIVPMFGEKILLKVVLDIVTIEHVEYPTFISAKKFILKLLLICWYWMYLYLRRKFFCNFILFLVIVIVYSTFLKVWSYSVFESLCIKCYKHDK